MRHTDFFPPIQIGSERKNRKNHLFTVCFNRVCYLCLVIIFIHNVGVNDLILGKCYLSQYVRVLCTFLYAQAFVGVPTISSQTGSLNKDLSQVRDERFAFAIKVPDSNRIVIR